MSTQRDYLEYMRRRRLADGTIFRRRCELRIWLKFVGSSWRHATRGDVERWLDTTPHYTPHGVYNRLAMLHQFYRWAVREGVADIDPTELIDRPRLPMRLPRPAPKERAYGALEAASGALHLALMLMIDGGLRCHEVSRLRWAQVDHEQGVVHVVGKGNKPRVVGMTGRLAAALIDEGAPGEHVLGVEWSPWVVSSRVNKHLRANDCPATAHQLRHLYATRLYRATGGDIRIVQQALGHASIATTAVYTLVANDDVINASRNLPA